MDIEDIKLFMLNTTAMGFGLAHIESMLAIVLLFISIGYTAQRWHFLRKDKTKSKNEN